MFSITDGHAHNFGYRIENNTVFVSRVLNVRQDYLRVLLDDGDWNRAEDTESRVKAAKSVFGILSDSPASSAKDQPSWETIAAMREVEPIAKDPSAKRYSDADELFHDLQE